MCSSDLDFEANKYLPAPGVFCRSKMISGEPFLSHSKHYYESVNRGYVWNFSVKLNKEMTRYWKENYTDINWDFDWKNGKNN